VPRVKGRASPGDFWGGHDLVVHDLRAETAKPHLAAGAAWATSPRQVAEASDIVLTSLPGPTEVEAVTLGEDSLLSGLGAGKVYVDPSTNSPTVVRRLHAAFTERGVAMLEAPVSGGRAVRTRKLAVWVGGDEAHFQRVRPVLDAMGDPPNFTRRLAHEDVRLAVALEHTVPLRVANLVLEEMTEALNRGWAERDSRSPMLLQEERAGVRVRAPAAAIAKVFERDPPA
jgi:hypothetical protein